MNTDRDKPEAEQIRCELEQARLRVAELENRLARLDGCAENQRQHRQRLDTDIEFISEFDVVEAQGVDLSAGGICFQVHEPLTFVMRFTDAGQVQERQARLIWAQNTLAGSRLGFQFTDQDTAGT